jgi:hypothetical protein
MLVGSFCLRLCLCLKSPLSLSGFALLLPCALVQLWGFEAVKEEKKKQNIIKSGRRQHPQRKVINFVINAFSLIGVIISLIWFC